MAENILITVLSKLLEVCKNRKIKVVLRNIISENRKK